MIDTDDDNLWRVNLFEVLGIDQEADEKEIRQVYKQLAKKYHPDRYPAGSPAQEGARDKFSDISRAYEILGNDQKRRHYLDTRRLLAEHLPEDQRPKMEAAPASPAPEAPKAEASKKAPTAPQRSTPAASTSSKADSDKGQDYKQKEAEEAAKEAKVMLRKNNLEEAISLYQRAISLMPNKSEYHSMVGEVYAKRGWTGMAQAAFKKALVINPQDPIAKKNYEPEKPPKKGLFGGLMRKFKKD